MNWDYLTNTQLVALALGLVFSVLAIAAVFFAFKNADKIKSQVIAVLLTMILPFLAITSWLILIFSFLEGFKTDELLTIFVSIAIALVICFMILVVSNALLQKHKKTVEKQEAMQAQTEVAGNLLPEAEIIVEETSLQANATDEQNTQVETETGSPISDTETDATDIIYTTDDLSTEDETAMQDIETVTAEEIETVSAAEDETQIVDNENLDVDNESLTSDDVVEENDEFETVDNEDLSEDMPEPNTEETIETEVDDSEEVAETTTEEDILDTDEIDTTENNTTSDDTDGDQE